jgi:hypothetical protein
MTAPSVAMMMEIAHLGSAEINRGGKVSMRVLCLALCAPTVSLVWITLLSDLVW